MQLHPYFNLCIRNSNFMCSVFQENRTMGLCDSAFERHIVKLDPRKQQFLVACLYPCTLFLSILTYVIS